MTAKLEKLQRDMDEKYAIWQAHIALCSANPFWQLHRNGNWSPSGMIAHGVAYTYTKLETAYSVRDYCKQMDKDRTAAYAAYKKALSKYEAAGGV